MAIFPTAVATDSDLYVAVNSTGTQLTDNPLTAGATTVNVVSTSGFPTVGFISIDLEIIKYTGTTASSFTGCTRGADGTTANSHVQNSQVYHNVIAAHHNALKEEIKAIEQNISDRIGVNVTPLRTPNGSAAAPSYSFSGDTDSGIYSTGNANELWLGAGGTAVARWRYSGTSAQFAVGSGSASEPSLCLANNLAHGFYRVTGLDVTGSSVPLAAPLGLSATIPGFTFAGDEDTGVYRVSANALGLRVGADDIITVATTGADIRIQDGSAGTPSIRFANDPNTGIYAPGTADRLNIVVGATTVTQFQLNAGIAQALFGSGSSAAPSLCIAGNTSHGFYRVSGLDVTGTSVPIGFQNGTAASPSIQFDGDGDTGIYRSAANTLDISTAGSSSFTVDGTNGIISSKFTHRFIAGSATTPSISFTDDPNTGFYNQGANVIAMAVDGARIMNLTTGLIGFDGTISPNADNVYKCGQSGLRWTEVWATNGTIQTSHSSTKSNIRDLEDLPLPRAVRFERDGRDFIGYLNDVIPQEGRPTGDSLTNYEMSVIGIALAHIQKLENRLAILEGRS